MECILFLGCVSACLVMLIHAETLPFAHKRRNYNIRPRSFLFPNSPKMSTQDYQSLVLVLIHKHSLEANSRKQRWVGTVLTTLETPVIRSQESIKMIYMLLKKQGVHFQKHLLDGCPCCIHSPISKQGHLSSYRFLLSNLLLNVSCSIFHHSRWGGKILEDEEKANGWQKKYKSTL